MYQCVECTDGAVVQASVFLQNWEHLASIPASGQYPAILQKKVLVFQTLGFEPLNVPAGDKGLMTSIPRFLAVKVSMLEIF